jgi:hypothetical protein
VVLPPVLGGIFANSLIDCKLFSNDPSFKFAIIDKPIQNVLFDLGINTLYYGLGQFPAKIATVPKELTNNQKLWISTANSVNKEVIKKTFNDGMFPKQSFPKNATDSKPPPLFLIKL